MRNAAVAPPVAREHARAGILPTESALDHIDPSTTETAALAPAGQAVFVAQSNNDDGATTEYLLECERGPPVCEEHGVGVAASRDVAGSGLKPPR